MRVGMLDQSIGGVLSAGLDWVLVEEKETRSFINILTGGTASADSDAGAGYEANKAVDGNLATQWKSGTASLGHNWEYDFGSGNEVEVRKIRIRTWKDGGGGGLKTFSLQCTNDHTNWYNVGSWVAEDSDGIWQYFEAQVPLGTYGAFRYWVISTQDNYRSDNYSGFYEIEMGEEESGTGPQTSVVFEGLDGDTDEEYRMVAMVVNGYDGGPNFYLLFNGDNSENYGQQILYGTSSTIGSARATTNTRIVVFAGASLGQIAMADMKIYAKSGFVRTVISESAYRISDTTISLIAKNGQSWNNSGDIIADITFASDQPGGLGVGTRIFLFKRNSSSSQVSSGFRTGDISVKGIASVDEMQTIKRISIPALDASTKLMLHGDSVTIDATGKAVTASGAGVATDQYKFSETKCAIYFDGVNDYLSLADSDDWNFGSGDFTIDFWARFSEVSNIHDFCGQFVDGNNRWYARYNGTSGGGALEIGSKSGGVTVVSFYTGNITLVTNTWYHIAFVVSSGTPYIFLNGVSQTLVGTTTGTLPDLASVLNVGVQTPTGGVSYIYYFNGYFNGFRVEKGNARWTSSFTPPVFSSYGGPRTRLMLSGLNGNTDILYEIRSRIVSGTANNNNVSGWWNSDESTGNISGYQYIYGSNTTAGAGRSTSTSGAWLQLGYHTGLGEQSVCIALVYAKSGAGRIALTNRIEEIATTTVTSAYCQAHIWNDTSQNINELLINSAPNGIGVGSVIEIATLRRK